MTDKKTVGYYVSDVYTPHESREGVFQVLKMFSIPDVALHQIDRIEGNEKKSTVESLKDRNVRDRIERLKEEEILDFDFFENKSYVILGRGDFVSAEALPTEEEGMVKIESGLGSVADELGEKFFYVFDYHFDSLMFGFKKDYLDVAIVYTESLDDYLREEGKILEEYGDVCDLVYKFVKDSPEKCDRVKWFKAVRSAKMSKQDSKIHKECPEGYVQKTEYKK